MRKDQFIELIVNEMHSEMNSFPSSLAAHAADLIYDPLLSHDDRKQFHDAAKAFGKYGDGFYRISDALARNYR